ncbi:MAG: HAD-IIIA family hydrolase, partial [Pseudomonadota bacterium]|nr:HAD-IIIA family hydrolase [Pseudomonadota bacterium]
MLINDLEMSARAPNGAQSKQPVGGWPILGNLLAEAARFGFEKVLLLASDQADRVKDYLAASGVGERLGLQVEVIVAIDGAGTGGALWLARNHLDEWFYMLNQNCWFDFNWLSLIAVEGADQAIATIGVRRLTDAKGYSVVETDGSMVRRFMGRSNLCGPGDVNSGVYLISRVIIENLSTNCSLESDVFPILASAGRLRAEVRLSCFRDIGMPTDFEMVPDLIPRRRRPAVFLDRDGTLNEDTGYVHLLEDFRWLPNSEMAIRKFNNVGFYVFVVTNQSGVARGVYGERDVLALHALMQSELRA